MTLDPLSNAGGAAELLDVFDRNVIAKQTASTDEAAAPHSPQSSARAVGDRTTFSSRFWNPEESIDFSMESYTRNGTRIQIEAGERALTMGHFANKGPLTNKFQLAGARAPMDLAVTFTTANGQVST